MLQRETLLRDNTNYFADGVRMELEAFVVERLGKGIFVIPVVVEDFLSHY